MLTKGGYKKKIIWLDLSNKKHEIRELGDEMLTKFVGGVGIATKILYDEGLKNNDPFSPYAPLIIMTGPLTGTIVPTSGRLTIVAMSPQTLSYGECDIGGTWGVGLKKAGYDGVVLSGQSEAPVYIRICQDDIKIEDASHLWGKDTFETAASLKKTYGQRAKVMCIGPAGEKLVTIAAIFTDGEHARAAGRGGLGAVMGSKKVKALLVEGNTKVSVCEPDKLRDSVRRSVAEIKERTKGLSDLGTAGTILFCEETGDLPIRNWAEGSWKAGAQKISGQVLKEQMFKKQFFCGSCVTGCGRVIEASTTYGEVKGGGPEYETLGALGSNCLIDDLAAIAVGNELCNRLGIDTISCGSVIAFAMEAFEKGLIKEKDIGYKIQWGDPSIMLRIIKDIAFANGFGKVLGKGVKGASEHVGQGAERFAVHVKGLEPPMHDPRACAGMGLAYATNPNGATHWPGTNVLELKGVTISGLGIFPEALDRFSERGKPQLVKTMQDYVTMINSIKMCRFLLRIDPSQIIEWFKLVTGLEHDIRSFLLSGERITNLKRLCNIRLGFGRKEDTLPDRIIKDKRKMGGAPDYLPDIESMVDEYYRKRKWNREGIPLPFKLEELGLEEERKFVS